MRYLLALSAFVSLFLFPYPFTLTLSFVASLYIPPIALLIGILADLLYFAPLPAVVPNISFPYASAVGALLSLTALFVRRFVKTRIIS